MPRKAKILLVDDQYPQLVALESVLAKLGSVVTVTSGRDALRRLLKEEFAVILLDVNMPGMDGFETAALIRRRKRSENTPIIFITAYPDEFAIARGYSLGAVDYILAPVVPDVLRSKVRVFVELYRKSERVRRQAARLRKRTAQLSALASQLIHVEDRERARLAQILHDHVQQLLAAASLRVQILRQQTAEPDASMKLKEVEELITQSIGTARSLSVELHPPILDSGGLAPALEWLARHMEKNFRLRVAVRCESNPEIPVAYRILLFDAIRELLLNVVKHSGAESARVAIREVDPSAISVTVEDDGMGFDASRITAPEAKLDHSGLRTLGEKLKALEGGLRIESGPTKGARIEMRLPLSPSVVMAPRRGNGERDEPAELLRESEEAASTTIRVLLADDHEILRKGLKSLLQRYEDIEVVGEAKDGQEAVDLARSLSPQVIVMDLSMPRLNGIEATRAIVSESPRMRVIGLSMKDGPDAMAAMLAAGAVSYLTKGGPPADLVTAIRTSMLPG
ncbi:MAG: response regulator, partial [Vicinamibacteria bacterium]